MDVLIRLLLRFVLVPIGYLAAMLAGCCVIVFGSWKLGTMLTSFNPDSVAYGLFGAVVAGPVLFIVLVALMFLPAAAGILIAEALAIRSWIYYALGGAISGWVGWQMFPGDDAKAGPLVDQPYVLAAGIAGGFAYWAAAGWTAGFWKPVFARPVAPQPQPALPAAPAAARLDPPTAIRSDA